MSTYCTTCDDSGLVPAHDGDGPYDDACDDCPRCQTCKVRVAEEEDKPAKLGDDWFCGPQCLVNYYSSNIDAVVELSDGFVGFVLKEDSREKLCLMIGALAKACEGLVADLRR